MRTHYVAIVGLVGVIWLLTDGRLDRTNLPVHVSSAPLQSLLSSVDLPSAAEELRAELERADLAFVQPAVAADVAVRVTGAVVNIRSGPGLQYRMVDVAEAGDVLTLRGEPKGSWVPIVLPRSADDAWIHRAYVELPD